MPVLFANPLVQTVLGWLAKWLWGKLSEAIQDQLAHNRIEKHVKDTMQKYESLILRYDDLQDKGQMTEAIKNEIRQEKIKLETDLINNIRR